MRSSLVPRFALSYFALYFPFLPLDGLPCLGELTAAWNDVFTGALAWIPEHVLHLRLPFLHWGPMRLDTAHGYERSACLLVAAAIVTGVWCVLARRKEDHGAPGEWLRVWLRYALANAMFFYGVAKVTLTQFSYPAPEKLVERFGEASPMGLLWTFMGYSSPYSVFTGSLECLAGLLLLFRRTSTLGALVAAGVMSNVVMLNLCYDVPLKLYSFHLLVMSALLLVPEARRLVDFFLLHRAIEPAPFAPHFAGSSTGRALALGKAAFLLLLIYRHGAFAADNLREARAPRTPLFGVYEVETFSRNGVDAPPLLTDKTRWRRMTASGSVTAPTIALWSMDDGSESFRATDDAEHRTLSLESRERRGKKTVWEYAKAGGDLVLRGQLDGDAVEVKLRRVDDSSFLLVSRGFHWVSQPVVNR